MSLVCTGVERTWHAGKTGMSSQGAGRLVVTVIITIVCQGTRWAMETARSRYGEDRSGCWKSRDQKARR